MPVTTIRLNDAEAALIKEYAALQGHPVSTLLKTALLERIEDEFDLRAAHQALAESDGTSIPLEEVMDRLGMLDQTDTPQPNPAY